MCFLKAWAIRDYLLGSLSKLWEHLLCSLVRIFLYGCIQNSGHVVSISNGNRQNPCWWWQWVIEEGAPDHQLQPSKPTSLDNHLQAGWIVTSIKKSIMSINCKILHSQETKIPLCSRTAFEKNFPYFNGKFHWSILNAITGHVVSTWHIEPKRYSFSKWWVPCINIRLLLSKRKCKENKVKIRWYISGNKVPS